MPPTRDSLKPFSEFLAARSLHRTFHECNLPTGFPAPRGSLIFSSVSASPDVRCEAKKKAVTVANQGGQVLWAFPVIKARNHALPAKPCQFDRQRAPFP